jgi:hypothetical protein
MMFRTHILDDERFIIIDKLDFSGRCSKSSSGEWYICWKDGVTTSEGSLLGFRESGHGSYALYNKKQEKVILSSKLERPNAGMVADNGTFCISDWHFGEGLFGTIYTFLANGEKAIGKRFEANIFNCAISDNGLYVICQTCENKASEDGNLLTLFNVKTGGVLFSINPMTPWADQYIFDVNNRRIGVTIRDGGTYYYDFDGKFLDEKKYDEEQLASSRYEVVINKAQNILKSENLDFYQANRVIEAIDYSLTLLNEDEFHYKTWAATAYKIQGLAYEFISNDQDALLVYQIALGLNPKIGLKRKIENLKKKLI